MKLRFESPHIIHSRALFTFIDVSVKVNDTIER